MEKQPIKLLEPWNGNERGTVLPLVPDTQAQVLIKRKIAKAATEAEAKSAMNAIEKASAKAEKKDKASEVEKAAKAEKKKKK